MSSYNRRSASKLGWTPQWFGVSEFGEDLQNSIKDFQGKYDDLKIDGMCGPVTFRRVKLERELRIGMCVPLQRNAVMF